MTETLEGPAEAMQLHKLRAFAAVAQHGNVHRASEIIHLSQPAVTRAVQQLEQSLGVVFFERTTRGMQLTRAGETVYRRVERALEQLHQAGLGIARLASSQPGSPLERLSGAVTERMLAALVAIERSGNEVSAANSIKLSQPALNRNLRQLEHLAAAPLFSRSFRGTRLTAAGEVLLRHAKLALNEIRFAFEELAALQGRLDGSMVVGVLPLSSSYLVPQAVERTLQDHRGMRIRVVDGAYERLSQGLRCADIDMIVGALRPDADEPYAVHEALFIDSLAVVARATHPLLKTGRPTCLADLAKADWVMPLSGTPSRAAFERAFRAEGIEPPRAQLEGTSSAVVRGLLLASDRFAFVSPRKVEQELSQGVLAVVPIALQQTERVIGVARLRDSEPSPGMAVFLHHLRVLSRPR
jgi:LysR family transcriptional regulator of gallate degradation